MLVERRCPGCGSPARAVCAGCRSRLPPPPAEAAIDGVDRVVVLHGYDAAVGRIVLAAKNGARRDLLRRFGRRLGAEVARRTPGRFDAVTWVPASPSGRARRGYDQGRVLARAAAGRDVGPPVRLLRRSATDGAGRKGLGRADRLTGPEVEPVRSGPRQVLLIDDVITTGASVAASVRALRRAGVDRVTVAAVAMVDDVHGAGPGGRPRGLALGRSGPGCE